MNEMRHLFGTNFTYDCVSIAEFEFFLMEDLDFCTIVFHPYKPLNIFVLNDTYRTDLCLIQPPHIVALAALYVTSVIHKNEIKDDAVFNFLKSINADMVSIVESAQLLFNLYAIWADYDESQIPAILAQLK
ncbi:hypothetical protein HDU91_006519 [Kappamyces sp. JEL0680]|nr:hypothetical protein HDU91_006519 [Kappamyces sp. JEL0680]